MKNLLTTMNLLERSVTCSLVQRSNARSSENDILAQEKGVVLRLFFDSSDCLNLVVTTPAGLEHSYEMRALAELHAHLAGWSEDRRPKSGSSEPQDVVEFSAGHLLDDEAPLWGGGFRYRESPHSTGDPNLGPDKLAIVAATVAGLSRLMVLAGAEGSAN